MTSIAELIRPHLANIKTYEPVDPPELLAKRAGIPEDQIIKLNGNENPFGGSPKASEALAKIPLHVYPDSQQRRPGGRSPSIPGWTSTTSWWAPAATS